jgi:adenine-specific DNA-methyltransferase
MDKNSLDVKAETLDRLREVLPEIFSENKIDYEKLKVMLGDNLEFNNERYHLNWAGKSDAFRALQLPTAKTLIPVKAESINFDNTNNIFIEGENLEVLKVLQKSYFGKVKMIYIDPPYNTGNDSFIYPDKFKQSKHEYEEDTDEFDDDGYRIDDSMFRKNSKDKGHYHSNWLNMMMPRLHLAKSLLRQDGVIFISIDDNEVHNLRLLCNEIFGEENFVEIFTVRSNPRGNQAKKYTASEHEFIICYAKSIDNFTVMGHIKDIIDFPKVDDIGSYQELGLRKRGADARKEDAPNQWYPIYFDPTNNVISTNQLNCECIEIFPKLSDNSDGRWRWSKSSVEEHKNKLLVRLVKRNGLMVYDIFEKYYFSNDKISKIKSLLYDKIFNQENGTEELKMLFENNKFFNYPKPINTIKYLLSSVLCSVSDIILDFFAGSGTTAHAVMELNKEDGGNRQYICVQLPEKCAEDSEAYKAGYKTIADICKERIRRVSQNIAQEITSSELDLGFKVFKLQDSNFKQWRDDLHSETELLEQVEMFIDPVEQHATTENIIYELLLKNGLDLNSKVVTHNGYFAVHNNYNQEVIVLMLKTQGDISENVKLHEQTIQEIIKFKPAKVIALDRIFNNDDQLKKNTALQMHDADIDFKTI